MLHLLSQTAEVPTSSYALLGAAVLALASVFGVAVKWLLNRVEEESKAKDALAQQMIDKVIPALTQTIDVVNRMNDLVRDIEIGEGRRRRDRDDR